MKYCSYFSLAPVSLVIFTNETLISQGNSRSYFKVSRLDSSLKTRPKNFKHVVLSKGGERDFYVYLTHES